MKHIILIRHAQPNNFSKSNNDIDRSLTDYGILQSKNLGGILKEKAIFPQVIFCSHAVRTRQTLQYCISEIGCLGEIILDYRDEFYKASCSDLIAYIKEIDDITNKLMIVGHNPTISMLACTFVENNKELDKGFSQASMALISINTTRWNDILNREGNLEWFVK